MLEDFKIDGNFIISVCAIVVSIAGIGIGLYYNWRNLKNTLEHNKKSVKPLISVNLEFTTENSNLLILNNFGLGPAIIDSICFKYREKYYNSLIEVISRYDENKGILMFMDVKLSQTTTLTKGAIIGSGEEVLLHKLLFTSKVNSDKFLKLLEDINIEINYLNIYGDTTIFKKLLMFKRNLT